MITPTHPLPITRQCHLLALSRSSVYYTPQPVPAADLALMRQLDELHLAHPFAGSRLLRDLLRLRGVVVGRKRVATRMRRMGIAALYRHPRTTRPHPGHQVFPYLLRDLPITVPNQVWAMDLTYLPMRHGFLYLVAVLDWATRRVLAWRLSNTMTTDVCLDALEAAIGKRRRLPSTLA
jgi:putative transposase